MALLLLALLLAAGSREPVSSLRSYGPGDVSVTALAPAGDEDLLTGLVRDGDGPSEAFAGRARRDGSLVWQKKFQPLTPFDETGLSLLPLPGGDEIVLTSSEQRTAPGERYLLRFSRLARDGSPAWHRALRPAVPMSEVFLAAAEEGAFVLLATAQDGLLVAKITGAGGLAWAQTISLRGAVLRASGLVASGDGWLVGGGLEGRPQGVLAALDRSGKVRRQKLYDNALATMAAVPGGGVVMAGRVKIAKPGWSDFDLQITRVDAAGRILWDRTIGTQRAEQWPIGIAATRSGILVLGGWSEPRPSFRDGWLLQLTPRGEIVWEARLDSGASDDFSLLAHDDARTVLDGSSGRIGKPVKSFQLWIPHGSRPVLPEPGPLSALPTSSTTRSSSSAPAAVQLSVTSAKVTLEPVQLELVPGNLSLVPEPRQ